MLALLVFIATTAYAAPPPGSDPNSEMAKWYKGLTRNDGGSCCDISDCRPAKYRQTNDGYEVLLRVLGDEKWVPIPDDKILNHIDNPTGVAVVCASAAGYIYCFVRPAET